MNERYVLLLCYGTSFTHFYRKGIWKGSPADRYHCTQYALRNSKRIKRMSRVGQMLKLFLTDLSLKGSLSKLIRLNKYINIFLSSHLLVKKQYIISCRRVDGGYRVRCAQLAVY